MSAGRQTSGMLNSCFDKQVTEIQSFSMIPLYYRILDLKERLLLNMQIHFSLNNLSLVTKSTLNFILKLLNHIV